MSSADVFKHRTVTLFVSCGCNYFWLNRTGETRAHDGRIFTLAVSFIVPLFSWWPLLISHWNFPDPNPLNCGFSSTATTADIQRLIPTNTKKKKKNNYTKENDLYQKKNKTNIDDNGISQLLYKKFPFFIRSSFRRRDRNQEVPTCSIDTLARADTKNF